METPFHIEIIQADMIMAIESAQRIKDYVLNKVR